MGRKTWIGVLGLPQEGHKPKFEMHCDQETVPVPNQGLSRTQDGYNFRDFVISMPGFNDVFGFLQGSELSYR